MHILIVLCLLFGAALVDPAVRALRPAWRAGWLLSLVSAIAALILIFIAPSDLPANILLSRPVSSLTFEGESRLVMDATVWPIAAAVVTIAVARLLTSPTENSIRQAFARSLLLTAAGISLVALMAGNALLLAAAWAAFDLAVLAGSFDPVRGTFSLSGLVELGLRLSAIGLLVMAGLQVPVGSSVVLINKLSESAGSLALAAVVVRILADLMGRRQAGSSLLNEHAGDTVALFSVAATLSLLPRIPALAEGPLLLATTTVAMAAGLYAGWCWFTAPDSARLLPIWLAGFSVLAVGATLQGNATGAAAWATSAVLGAAALLHLSSRNLLVIRLSLVFIFTLTCLPFTLSAGTWNTSSFGLLAGMLLIQAFFLAGYIVTARKGTRLSDPMLTRDRSGISSAALILVVQIVLGLAFWQGARLIGNPFLSFAVISMAALFVLAKTRLPLLSPVPERWLAAIAGQPASRATSGSGGLFRSLQIAATWFENLQEGESGVLWGLLALLVLISLVGALR